MSGAAVSGCTSAAPGTVFRSASATRGQKRRGSRSSYPTATHAARSARPAPLTHDRSSVVFPLPGGAHTTVTRADPSSRRSSPGRTITPPVP
jgi:hypothetical protein